MSQAAKIGFIGVGIMGRPMVEHLLSSGHLVQVFNRTRAKALPLELLGAQIVDSPGEAAADADIIITNVSRTEDVEAVLFGEQGASFSARKGALFVDMSTIDSTKTIEFALKLKELGCEFIDAPVSGGEPGAKNATLTIFCGGSENNIVRAKPILDILGSKINHMGDVGSGQAAKACNQILVAGALLGVAEALTYAQSKGLDLHQLIDATGSGAAQSWQLDNLAAKMADGDFAPGFMLDLLKKDLQMPADDLLQEQKLPVTEVMLEKLRELQAEGYGQLGTQAIFKSYTGQ